MLLRGDYMRDIIVSILGEYTPSLSPDGEVLGGLYSLDLTWIVGAICFVICLYSVLRLLGVLLKNV